MSGYKSYRKEKWLYFVFCVLAYFLPFIIVTSVFFPMIEAAKGFKIAIGLGIVFINAIPFLMGIFRAFFAHFPMFNISLLISVAKVQIICDFVRIFTENHYFCANILKA